MQKSWAAHKVSAEQKGRVVLQKHPSLLGTSVPKALIFLQEGRRHWVEHTLRPHALLTKPCTGQKEDTEGGVFGVCYPLKERKQQRQLPSLVKVCAVNC